MIETPFLALQRFGFGARPGDIARIQGDPVGACLKEVNSKSAIVGKPNLLSTPDAIRALIAFQATRRARLAANQDSMSEAGTKPGRRGRPANRERVGDGPREVFFDEVAARYEMAQNAGCGFAERLVWFWSNHFAVSAVKGGRIHITAGAFEREAIRPHVFGKFSDMLIAVEQHPTMLLFLDNYLSIGPNSAAGSRRGRGLNENLAREILELHTLGVNGGYKQDDVIALAKIITGWTGSEKEGAGRGTFMFNSNWHEPGTHQVLTRIYGEGGVEQGQAILVDLARHPSTARHIATKLVRHFVADDPPSALVENLEQVFLESDGDLAKVSRVLIESPAAWSAPATKLRNPQEFLAAMLRATGLRFEGAHLHRLLLTLGQATWSPGGPDGFPDTAAAWMSPRGMTGRLEVASFIARRAEATSDPQMLVGQILGENCSRETRSAIASADSRAQGLAILFASPEFQRR